MIKNYLFIALLALVFFGCGLKDENDQLKMENEELLAELRRANTGVETLQEVGALMDSIDNARNAVRMDLEEGTNYGDYKAQMEGIAKYVQDTEAKLDALERSFSESSEKNRAYIATIKRLKKELSTKSAEIAALNETVESYKSENEDLLTLVELQEAELIDRSEEIERKKEELNLLDNRIGELMEEAQISEADAYFARAKAVEEAANRTKLAPKKKKETYAEALDLYKRSFALGNTEAEAKIAELESKI